MWNARYRAASLGLHNCTFISTSPLLLFVSFLRVSSFYRTTPFLRCPPDLRFPGAINIYPCRFFALDRGCGLETLVTSDSGEQTYLQPTSVHLCRSLCARFFTIHPDRTNPRATILSPNHACAYLYPLKHPDSTLASSDNGIDKLFDVERIQIAVFDYLALIEKQYTR